MVTAGVVNVFAGAPTEVGGGADWPWGRAKMSSTTAVAISSAAAAASEALICLPAEVVTVESEVVMVTVVVAAEPLVVVGVCVTSIYCGASHPMEVLLDFSLLASSDCF